MNFRGLVRRAPGSMAWLWIAVGSCACQRPAPTPAAAQDVTPSVRLAPVAGHAGRPLAVVYSWQTGPAFRGFDQTVRAFVHVLADDGATLVSDDHFPEPLPETWTANKTYTYTRVVFPPKQFPGRVDVHLGLFEPGSGRRLALHGEDVGQTAYRVARATLLPHAHDPAMHFGPGFFPPDGDLGRPFATTRWTGREAQVSLANPLTDALLLVQAATSVDAFTVAPALSLELGSTPLGPPYEIRSEEPFTLAFRVDAATLGTSDRCDLRFVMNAAARRRNDPRTLGVQVYDIALLPIEDLPLELLALARP